MLKAKWRSPKIRGTVLGLPIVGAIVFGVYMGVPLFWETTKSAWYPECSHVGEMPLDLNNSSSNLKPKAHSAPAPQDVIRQLGEECTCLRPAFPRIWVTGGRTCRLHAHFKDSAAASV